MKGTAVDGRRLSQGIGLARVRFLSAVAASLRAWWPVIAAPTLLLALARAFGGDWRGAGAVLMTGLMALALAVLLRAPRRVVHALSLLALVVIAGFGVGAALVSRAQWVKSGGGLDLPGALYDRQVFVGGPNGATFRRVWRVPDGAIGVRLSFVTQAVGASWPSVWLLSRPGITATRLSEAGTQFSRLSFPADPGAFAARVVNAGRSIAGRTFRVRATLRTPRPFPESWCRGIWLQERNGSWASKCQVLAVGREWQAVSLTWMAPKTATSNELQVVLNNLAGETVDVRGVTLDELVAGDWRPVGPFLEAGPAIATVNLNGARGSASNAIFAYDAPMRSVQSVPVKGGLVDAVIRVAPNAEIAVSQTSMAVTPSSMTAAWVTPFGRNDFGLGEPNLTGHSVVALALLGMLSAGNPLGAVVAAAGGVAGVALTGSRAAAMGLLVGGLWALWFLVVPRRRALVASILLLATLALIAFLGPGDFGRVFSTWTSDSVSRPTIWAGAWAAMLSHPFAGLGGAPGAFAAFFSAHAAGQLPFAIPHAHNFWLQFAALYGEPGLLAAVGLALGLIGLAWRHGRWRSVAFISGLLVMNVFDYTLLFPGVAASALLGLNIIPGLDSKRQRTTLPAWTTGSAVRPGRFLPRMTLNVLVLLAGDLFAITLAVWSAFEVRGVILGDNTIPRLAIVLLPMWVGAAWLEGLFPSWGLSRADYARRIVRAIFTCFLLGTSVLYFGGSGPGWARIALLLSSALGLLTVPLVRWALRTILLTLGLWGVPVAVLGGRKTGALVIKSLQEAPHFGFHPVALYDDDPALLGAQVAGVYVLGPVEGVRESQLEVAIVAMPGIGAAALLDLIRRPLAGVRHVLVIPDLLGLAASWVQARDVNGTLALEVQRHLLRPEAQAAKRALDLLGSLIGGLLISPLLLGLALAVKLDSPGPVFYRHARVGRNGRRLWVWKYRTMAQGADAVLADYLTAHPDLRAEWGHNHKLRQDPRITRVGRFLRRTSLDELPQLFNVLAGEMSLVGPRPIVQGEIQKYGQDFDVYTQVLPGMTGLWQASGRNDTSYAQRVSLDVYYIRNWSVWLDLVILLSTPGAVLSSRGAY